MYSNNIVNFQESTTILNACTKVVWKLIEATTYLILLQPSQSKYFCHKKSSMFVDIWPMQLTAKIHLTEFFNIGKADNLGEGKL